MKSEDHVVVVEDLLDVPKADPSILELKNAVVLLKAAIASDRAAVIPRACSHILKTLCVLGLIAAVTNMPDQVFDFIGDVIVVLMVSCCYMVVVVLRQKAIAKNVARGDSSLGMVILNWGFHCKLKTISSLYNVDFPELLFNIV